MKRIIDGKRYDTDTATRLADLVCDAYTGDFEYHDTGLYLTKSGQYFLSGGGNAASLWGRKTERGRTMTAGYGIKPITGNEARQHLEDAEEVTLLEKHFEIVDA